MEKRKKCDACCNLADDSLDFTHNILFTFIEFLVRIVNALLICLYIEIPSFQHLYTRIWQGRKNIMALTVRPAVSQGS